jgi:uncharacterized protein (DUF1684 family)
MARFAVTLALLSSCCAAFPALADTAVTGTLWLSAAARNATTRQAPDARSQQQGVNEGVVWIAKVPSRVEARLSAPRKRLLGLLKPATEPPLPRVAMREDRFAPRVVAVPAGSRVEFANSDRFYHSAFSVSGAKRFDLGKSPPGRRDTLSFTRAGVINLHCEIHPDAVGYVVVTPNRVYAKPDATGRFRLPKLPPGRYWLHAWHPQKGELELPFDVPRRGAVVLNPTF